MNGAHKIAVFGKGVYILHVAEMARDCVFLLFLWSLQAWNSQVLHMYCGLVPRCRYLEEI